MKKARVIIIDDERAARSELKRLLSSYAAAFEIMGDARHVEEARLLINEHQPDVLFLDIRMPGASGFDLLESLSTVPEVIFTTAYDEYAVKAFETNALDYLVKPIRQERFAAAIEKLQQRFSEKEILAQQDRRIFVKDGQQCFFVPLAKIQLIESRDNYACLHIGGKKALIKSSLNQLEEKLDEQRFFRINRAQIINTQYIQRLTPLPGGRLQIQLSTGQLLEASDRQSVKLRSLGRL